MSILENTDPEFDFPEIVNVEFKDNLIMVAEFDNGIKKEYDCNRLLSYSEHCKKLLNSEFFKQGKIRCYSIEWDNDISVDMYGVWEHGEEVKK